MAKFDFITSADFRASLESDYAELKRSRASESWKSTLVLSGSIIEALLIDYLRESSPSVLGKKDPLRLDLAEAIALCRDHNIISQRATDLCSVVRSYRNLLHPGRQIRLQEAPPSQQSADIAIAVVDVDTLWRHRISGESMHWEGRACKGYTKVDAQWLLIYHTGLLDYSKTPSTT